MCCPESWISIQTNGTIVVQQNNPMTNINNNRNKTNWILLCEEWKYIRLYIYHIHIPYVISRARHRYTDLMIGRAQLVVHWQRVLNAYIKWPQITTTTTTKWWKNKKTRMNTRFIKNIQLLFIIKKPNNNRLCFYFIRFDFSFWFSFSSYNGFRNIQSTLFGQNGLSHQDIYNMVSPHGLI